MSHGDTDPTGRAMTKLRLVTIALLTIAIGSSTTAGAAEIKVLSSGNMLPILPPLIAEFERASGHKLQVSYGSAGQVRDRLHAGEAADATIVQRSYIDEL